MSDNVQSTTINCKKLQCRDMTNRGRGLRWNGKTRRVEVQVKKDWCPVERLDRLAGLVRRLNKQERKASGAA